MYACVLARVHERDTLASGLCRRPLVFDVNYNPAVTALMAQAQSGGCTTIGGLEMLIEQGLEQNRVWLQSNDAPAEAVRAAVFAKYRS